MRRTNRALNRTLLIVLGLLLVAVGALVAAAGFLPAVADAWAATASTLLGQASALLGSAPLPGPVRSWWAVAWVGGLLLAAALCVAWIASQGGGRTRRLAQEDDGGRGTTVVDVGLVSAAVKNATADNRLVVATAVSAWELPRATGLQLRLQARQGASPSDLAGMAEELVTGIDAWLGDQIPVLVRITSGARTATARRGRVQ